MVVQLELTHYRRAVQGVPESYQALRVEQHVGLLGGVYGDGGWWVI